MLIRKSIQTFWYKNDIYWSKNIYRYFDVKMIFINWKIHTKIGYKNEICWLKKYLQRFFYVKWYLLLKNIYRYFNVKVILESSNNTQNKPKHPLLCLVSCHENYARIPANFQRVFIFREVSECCQRCLKMIQIFLHVAKASKDLWRLRTTCPDLWARLDKLAYVLIQRHDTHNAWELTGICMFFTHNTVYFHFFKI